MARDPLRLHTCRTPLQTIRDTEQPHPFASDDPPGKPRGLWYGVGSAWLDWCRAEGMDGWIGRYTYALELRDTVLRLTGAEAVDAFAAEFCVTPPWAHGLRARMWIDWRAVAGRHDGVEIAPYLWSLRLDPAFSWYYGWDCASGCVWRARAVAGFRRVRRPRLARR